MNQFFRNPFFVRFLIFFSIIPAVLACQVLSQETPSPNEDIANRSETPAPNEDVTNGSETPAPVEMDLELGPGNFDFPDSLAGLDQLSSFKAYLTVSFEGTKEGQPAEWSNTSILVYQTDPQARTLNFETTAQGQDPSPIFRAVMNGAAYEQSSDGLCTATLLEPADPGIEYMHPAIAISGIFGAEEAGHETIDGIETNHYTFDERAIAQAGLNESAGELWITSQGGYLVRYHLTTTGDENYFGEGTKGTLTWNYELSEINQVPPIELPESCPPGMLDAPLLDDASNVMNAPGLLQYETAASVADALAFYEQQLPGLGWADPVPTEDQLSEGNDMEGVSPEEMEQILEMMQSLGFGQGPGQTSEPTATPDPNKGSLTFQRGSLQLLLFITRADNSTKVLLVLRNLPQ